MLRPINRLHLFLLAHQDLWASHVLLADCSILWPFEAVKEVRSERAIEVDLQSGDYGRNYEFRVAEAVGVTLNVQGKFCRERREEAGTETYCVGFGFEVI